MTNLAWETPFEPTEDKTRPSHTNKKLKDTSDADIPIEFSSERGKGDGGRNRSSGTSSASNRRKEHHTRKPTDRASSGIRKVHRTRTHEGVTPASSTTGKHRGVNHPPSPPTLQRSTSLQGQSQESRPLRRHRRHEHQQEQQSLDNRSTISAGSRRSPSMSRSSGRKDRARMDRSHSREDRRTGTVRTNSSSQGVPVGRRVSHSDKRTMRKNPRRTKSEELAGSDGGDRMRYYRERVNHHPRLHRDTQNNPESQLHTGRRERQDGSHKRPGPRRAKSYVDRHTAGSPPSRAALANTSNPSHRDSRMPPLVSRQSAKATDPLFDPKLVGLLAHQAEESENEYEQEQEQDHMGPEILLDHDDDSASVSDYDEDEEDDPLTFIKPDFGYGAPKATAPLIANDTEKNPSLFTALSKVENSKRDTLKQSDDDDNHSVGSEGTAATTSSTLSFAKEKLSHAKKKVAGSLLKLVSGPNPNNNKVEKISSSNHAARGITIMGPMLKLGSDDEDDDEDFY